MEELEHLSETNSTVTIFAPDDQAFEGFDEDSECWTPEELEHFVRGHMVHDEIPLETMTPNSTYLFTSETAQPLRVVSKSTALTVNDARIVKADDLFADGLMHRVDQLLVNPENSKNKNNNYNYNNISSGSRRNNSSSSKNKKIKHKTP